MVFSAVSMVSSFEADDLVRYTRFGRGGRKKTLDASLRHIDAVRSRTKAGRGKSFLLSCFIQTELKRPGSYLVVSTHTLGPLHWCVCVGGGGGVRGGITSSIRHVLLLV